MPFGNFKKRKMGRKRPGNKYRKKIYSKKRKNRELMIYYPKGNISPLPPRYRTKLVITNYCSSGTGGTSNVMQLNLALNWLGEPFSLGTTNLTYRGPANGTQLSTGFTQICNVNTYQQYRVFASAIELDAIPGNNLDGLICTITPSNATSVPANVGVAEGAPYTTRYEVTPGRTSNRNSVLKNYITMHKFLGISKRAIEDDLSSRFTGTYNGQPGIQFYWVVNMNSIDGAALVSNAGFRITITHYVEFWGLNSATMVQT